MIDLFVGIVLPATFIVYVAVDAVVERRRRAAQRRST